MVKLVVFFFDTDLTSRASNFGTHASWKEKKIGEFMRFVQRITFTGGMPLLSDGVGTAQAISQECIGKMTEITHEIS